MRALPFNRAHATGREFDYIREAIANGHLSGNGPFTRRCTEWLEGHTGSAKALLTPSCSSALEMAMLIADIGPGDEVVMPSFTFVSTANAVALRGATPVFADVDSETFTLDHAAVREAVTPRTRAIVPVHYAGVGCAMEELLAVAERHSLLVVEDAAQGVLADYDGRPLGSLGQLGCLSFHETKNVTCGEGGALIVNDAALVERAEVIQEKGTDRSRFLRGQLDKYTWVELGSSFVPSEISAAFLWAQLESAERITARRLEIWNLYHEHLSQAEHAGQLRRPVVPAGRRHNAHMYYVLADDLASRDRLIEGLANQGIMAVFHYVPLHSSPAGKRYGRTAEPLPNTEDAAARLLRLPLWVDMTDEDVDRVARTVVECL